jgi:hypothetical protein
MSNYGTGAVQGAGMFHAKHSTRHQFLARSEATQTYNPRFQGTGSGDYMHLVDFHNFFSSHILYLFLHDMVVITLFPF